MRRPDCERILSFSQSHNARPGYTKAPITNYLGRKWFLKVVENLFVQEKFRYLFVIPCIMETVSLRLDSSIAKQIERDIKEFNYSTKTEFLREAIREKLKDNEKERVWKALFTAAEFLRERQKQTKNSEN
jgi:Arc/MetJ-type ribon-helix-helix transcriptional regulator